jgi:YggT family protein
VLVFDVVRVAFQILEVLIVVRVLMSWLRPSPANPVFRFVYDLTEPILGPVRRLLPAMGPFDLSPLVALLLLYAVEAFILQALRSLLFS